MGRATIGCIFNSLRFNSFYTEIGQRRRIFYRICEYTPALQFTNKTTWQLVFYYILLCISQLCFVYNYSVYFIYNLPIDYWIVFLHLVALFLKLYLALFSLLLFTWLLLNWSFFKQFYAIAIGYSWLQTLKNPSFQANRYIFFSSTYNKKFIVAK